MLLSTHLTIFKYDDVIDTLALPLSDFRALKSVCAEIASLKQHSEGTLCLMSRTLVPPSESKNAFRILYDYKSQNEIFFSILHYYL